MTIPLLALLLGACGGEKGDTGGGDSGGGGDDTEDPLDTGNGPDGGATVDNACSPDDGPALFFQFGLVKQECGAGASTGAAYLALTLYTLQPGPLPEGRTVTWSAEDGTGQATYKAGRDDPWLTGIRGSVSIDTWGEETVKGAYEARFEKGVDISDSFEIPYCDTPPGCG